MQLERLQRLLNHGHELKVSWLPRKIKCSDLNGRERLCGEVVGETIYIYEEDENEALRTLRQEIIDMVDALIEYLETFW